MLKRLFDIIVAIMLLIFLVPVLAGLVVLVVLILGKPVLFRQERPGLNGVPFILYKFRTMTDGRDKGGKMLSDDERLTGLGYKMRKYSLDELPQLYNIVRGDISFVGPRPLLMEYLERYDTRQARRHDIKPGITGWAQVNGRNALTWDEKFNLDLWYVDNQNFLLDLKIIALTILKVLKAEGISQEGSVTMPEFMGSRDQGKED